MSNASDPIDDADRPGSSGRHPIIDSALKRLRDETPSVDSRRTLLAALGLDQPMAASAQPVHGAAQPAAPPALSAAGAEQPSVRAVAKANLVVPLATWAAMGLALGTLAVWALHILGAWR